MSHFSLTVVRNTTVGIVAQILIKLLSFTFTVLVIRHLGAEEYGQYAAVLAFGGVFVFLSDLGLSPFMVRAVARLRDQPQSEAEIADLLTNVLSLRFLLALLTACVIIGFAVWTRRSPEMVGAIALGTLGLIMYAAQGTSEAMLAGFERLDITAAARVAYQLAFVVLGTIALVVGAGYYGIIVANLIGVAILTYLCWRGVRRLDVQLGRIDAALWRPLVRASIPFGIIGFTLGLSYKFDSILLNLYQDDMQTGYYNAAYSLVFSVAMISNIMNTTLYPSLARQATADPEKLPAIYDRSIRYLLMVSLPIAVGTATLADQVILFFFDEGYSPAVPALRLVCWVIPLMFMTEFFGYVILIDSREQRVARAVAISTSVNIGLNFIFVPRYGFLAAATMTVLTEAILLSQYLYLLRNWIRRIDWQLALLRPVLAAGLVGLVAHLLRDLPLGVNVAIAATCYVVALYLLRVFGPDELLFLHELRVARRNKATLPL